MLYYFLILGKVSCVIVSFNLIKLSCGILPLIFPINMCGILPLICPAEFSITQPVIVYIICEYKFAFVVEMFFDY